MGSLANSSKTSPKKLSLNGKKRGPPTTSGDLEIEATFEEKKRGSEM